MFDPGADVPPERHHCSFTVQASPPGAFGRTVQISDRGAVGLDGLR